MGTLKDDIYNWLTIKVVRDFRPKDLAAVETEELFYAMLEKDHHLSNIIVTKDDDRYFVAYEVNGESNKVFFPRELIEVMLDHINEAPDKYKIYPEK